MAALLYYDPVLIFNYVNKLRNLASADLRVYS